MGEVRAHIELMNTADVMLVRRGLADASQVRRYDDDALVDTGSVRLCLPPSVVEALGLEIIDQVPVELADGEVVQVVVTEPVLVRVLHRETDVRALVLGSEMLIGQTILETLDLFVDPVNGGLVPNPAHPHGIILNVK